MSIKPFWWLAGSVAVYLSLAVAADLTYIPWSDEAWFATPGINLVMHGSFGTPVLDETSVWNARNLRGINQRTYWFMPLHPLVVGAWTLAAGKTLFAVRFLSAIWGLGALGAWFLILLKLAEPDGLRPALFMTGLLAIDFQFIWCAGVGRMDMMTEALLAAAFASYLWLRENNLGRAILVSQTFIMLAGMTHPIALAGFAGVLFLTLWLDARKLRWRYIALAAAPYAVAAVAWGIFILKDPSMFRDQFYGNITGRLARPGGFFQSLRDQYSQRFFWMYGLHPGKTDASKLKFVIFLIYMSGLAAGWLMRDFRAKPLYRAWLILTAVLYFGYTNLDKDVHFFYLIHIITPAIAVLALVLDWVLRTRRVPAWAVTGVFVIVGTIQLMTTASRVREDAYHRAYLDTTAYIQEYRRPGDLVMGSSELGWELGFWDGKLIDDFRLGYFTGKRPDIIVVDQNRYQEWISNLKTFSPPAYSYTSKLLNEEFRQVHKNSAYTIYFRRGNTAAPASQDHTHP